MTEDNRTTVKDLVRNTIHEWEDLQRQKEQLAGQQKNLMAIAKEMGFNTKAIREVIKRRKEIDENLEILDSDVELYENFMK